MGRIYHTILLLIDYSLFYFAGPDDFILAKTNIANIPTWANIWNIVCFTIVVIICVYMMFNWMASVHRIRKWRLLVSLLIIYFPIGLLHAAFVAPLVSEVLKAVAEIGDSIT